MISKLMRYQHYCKKAKGDKKMYITDMNYKYGGDYLNEKFADYRAVQDVINYIANNKKTRGHFGGFGCSGDPEQAMDEFYVVHDKMKGVCNQRVKHYIVAFNQLVNRNKADEYARLIAYYFAPDYQVFYGVHIEDNRTHLHFCVNAVNSIDYKMIPLDYEYSKQFFQYVKGIRELSYL